MHHMQGYTLSSAVLAASIGATFAQMPMEPKEDAGAVKMPKPVAPAPPMSTAATGTDVLNFALNLECLEAEFYSFAAFGRGLSAAQRGGGDGAVGGRKAKLSPEVQVIFLFYF